MKRLALILSIASSALILAACGGNVNNSGSGSDNNSGNSTQLTGQPNESYYQGVIKNGHYLTSKSRGVNVAQDQNQFNLKSFENELLGLSKRQFSTKSYIFQEGQYISTGTAEDWLSRKSKSNPSGLNPSGGRKSPIYLQQMDEQDFLTQNGKSFQMKGMTVGLGLNSVYYYQKEKYGNTYSSELNDADIQAQGKKMANKVLARLRQKSQLKNIPIVIALYKGASNDSLVGGNFFAYSVNDGGSTKVNSWKKVNERNYVFPIQSNSKNPNNNDSNDFDNFKSQVQNFFPNISGVTAQAHYVNGSLNGMHVNVTTQFYSQTEIISFTHYLQSAANKYLPDGVPTDITVSSTTGIQSFLSRSANSKQFSSHVFNSY